LGDRRLLATYVIDPQLGDDDNPGTAEQPWATYSNIVAYDSEEDKPPGHVQLESDDAVLFKPGAHSFSYDFYNEKRALYLNNVHGEHDRPIVLRADPGAVLNARLAENSPPDERQLPPLFIEQCSHIVVQGFEITAYGQGIVVSEASHVRIIGNWIHDVDGIDDNNVSGIYLAAAHDTIVEGNLLADNYDRTATNTNGEKTPNSRHVVVFGSRNVRITGNTVLNTPTINARLTGAGIVYKHLGNLGTEEEGWFEVDHNIIRNAWHTSIGSAAPNSRVHHNLVINSGPIVAGDIGGTARIENNVIEFNTLSNLVEDQHGGGFSFGLSEDYPVGANSWASNIALDARSYNIDRGIVSLGTYLSDELYEMFVGNFSSDNNVYFNSYHDLQFNIFAAGPPDFGTMGGTYSWAEWRAQGFDVDGLNANPQLDEAYVPQLTSAKNKGWYAGDDARLTVLVPQDHIWETGAGSTTVGYLIRSGTSSEIPLTAVLNVTDASQVTVPSEVTIPSGQAWTTFTITGVDDGSVDGPRAVRIDAAQHGFSCVSNWVRVHDANEGRLFAEDDVFTFHNDGVGVPLGVLANDQSSIGTMKVVETSAYGASIVSVTSDGTAVVFTPPSRFFGHDTFSYRVTDGLASLWAEVVVWLQKRWTNASNPKDVNADEYVTALDALLGINELNLRGAHVLSLYPGGDEANLAYIDTSSDGVISPLDVLIVINEINRQSREAGEGEGTWVETDVAMWVPVIHRQVGSVTDVALHGPWFPSSQVIAQPLCDEVARQVTAAVDSEMRAIDIFEDLSDLTAQSCMPFENVLADIAATVLENRLSLDYR